ncbi:MAG: rod shape-determining protein MreD [Chloroflexi bacterium]|nr:rod shape-determining protein MreD [Chloroflexota bacterium]
MARYVGIPILLMAAIFNATVMAELRVWQGAPDLVFLLVISWALLAGAREALAWAIIGSIFQDALSLVPLGTSALGMILVIFMIDFSTGTVSRRNVFIPPLMVLAGTPIYHLAILAVLWMIDQPVPFTSAFVYVTLPTLVYHLIFILPVFRAVGLVHRWLTPRRVALE